jgi:hypothetical protein
MQNRRQHQFHGAAMLDPADPRFVTGTEEDREAARREWHKQRFLAQLQRSELPELPLEHLAFGRFGGVEDTRDGRLYTRRPDELADLDYATGVVAYYLDEHGSPHLLEEPHGPQSRQALEAEQAALEERRNQPRPKPSWLTK